MQRLETTEGHRKFCFGEQNERGKRLMNSSLNNKNLVVMNTTLRGK